MRDLRTPAATDHGTGRLRPLIAHVVFRFDYGGLENGLVNLINRMPKDRFRHCVIALTEATDYRLRLRRNDVEVHALGKKPGKDLGVYQRLVMLLRRLRPTILHTRNVGTLDCAPLGRLAGIPACVHGEHGWDTHDPDGTRFKYRFLRRAMNPFVDQFIVVSEELYTWLIDRVGVCPLKVSRICNGVDTTRFHPVPARVRHVEVAKRFGEDAVIIGSVLRFEAIKDPMNLVEAFLHSRRKAAESGVRLHLAMIGDGRLRAATEERAVQAGAADAIWFPGSRDDIPELLQSMDIFALPSRREGISNTLLEAMASGLPLVATDTGGNSELVDDGTNGTLVPTEDPEALGEALLMLAINRDRRIAFSKASRARALDGFSIERMVAEYERVYDEVTSGSRSQE
jgi:sugar transferase (PEP-CTERM/EpsH1 system associated)